MGQKLTFQNRQTFAYHSSGFQTVCHNIDLFVEVLEAVTQAWELPPISESEINVNESSNISINKSRIPRKLGNEPMAEQNMCPKFKDSFCSEDKSIVFRHLHHVGTQQLFEI